jgi:hypothetical protein
VHISNEAKENMRNLQMYTFDKGAQYEADEWVAVGCWRSLTNRARCSGQMLDSWFVSSPLVKNIGSSKLKAMMGDDTQQIGVIGAGINA